MKETFYFSHDYNTRSDPKIKRLFQKHGLLGYGIFWALIEDLYQNANALPTDYESIAYDLRTECELVKSIVNDFDLFQIVGETFQSLSIERRLLERSEKSNKAKDSANARWNRVKDANALNKDANALQTQSDSNAIKESKEKERKEKERKEKERKEKNTKNVFSPPSSLDVENYFFKNGYKREAGTKAYNYYSIANWQDSKGNKVKNWKQKMQAVWFKDEHRIMVIQPSRQPLVNYGRYVID